MIAAEEHPVRPQRCPGGDVRHVGAETRGGHAAVPPELIDLVRGRLDQQPLVMPLRLAQGRFDDQRM